MKSGFVTRIGRKALVAIAILSGLSASSTFGATVFYASPTGSATGAGTAENPMTIDTAIAAALASNDDEIQVTLFDGAYTLLNGCTLNKPITISGASADASKVTITTTVGTPVTMKHAEALLENLTFDGDTTRRSNGIIYFPSDGNGSVIGCVIKKGNTSGTSGISAGIMMKGPGLVDRCKFVGNAYQDGGAGVALTLTHADAVARNCLITGTNPVGGWGNGKNQSAVYVSAGTLESCTIAGNKSYEYSGLYATGGTIRNCIISGNAITQGGVNDGKDNIQIYNKNNAATIEYCVTPTYVAGEGNIIVEEPFVDAANGNYYPRAINTIVDAGSNRAWMTGSFDLDGNPRICTTVEGKNHTVDIGAYESSEVPVAEASVSFVINGASSGIAPCSISFAATAVNFGTAENVVYTWDFGDGTMKDVTGDGDVSHEYAAPGVYTVSLSVKNETDGIDSLQAESTAVTIVGKTFYVAESSGSGKVPYATPETAAHDINDILEFAIDGCDVEIAAGTYTVTKAALIKKRLFIYGATGKPEDVVIQRGSGSHGIFEINADATVASLTIQGGSAKDRYSGGNVTISNGGTVTNCIIRNGQSNAYNGGGGGVHFAGAGLVSHCIITNNTGRNDDDAGGAVWLRTGGGIVRNCLIADNRQTGGNNKNPYGGGVRIDSGLLESCTIVHNASDKCAGVWAKGGTVLNCLIGENVTASDDPNAAVFAGSASYFKNCAAPVQIGGTDCLLVPSPFVSAATGDYRPAPGETSAINGAALQTWMVNGKDLAGNDRVLNELPDIGAYEVDPSAIKSLNFSPDKTQGFAPLAVTFTAQPSNLGEADDLRYVWTIDGTSLEPLASPELKHAFTDYGRRTVSLTVQNTVSGESFTSSTTLEINVLPKTLYVSNDGSGIWPFATPETATNSLSAAVEAALSGATVLVKAGEYTLDAEIALTLGVEIRGETQNPTDVIVQCGEDSHRLFTVKHKNAVLSALTIQGGSLGGNASEGANVYIAGDGGMVTNCVIRQGDLPGYNSRGSAVFLNNGLLTHCIITNNTGRSDDNAGGAVYIGGDAIVRNCLIAHNAQTGGNNKYSYGAGVRIANGRLENCTIAGNSSERCAGVWAEGGQVVNCLIDGNLVTDEGLTEDQKTQYAVWAGSASAFSHCAAPTVINPAEGSGCVVLTNDPFKNMASGNYRLAADAEAVNKALFLDWMTGATDLDGKSRIIRKPDIGCYEFRKNGLKIILR